MFGTEGTTWPQAMIFCGGFGELDVRSGAVSSLSPFVLAPAVVAEVSLVLWLLVKGVSVQTRDEPVPAAA